MASNEVEIRVTADTKSAERDLKGLRGSLDGFSRNAKIAGTAFTAIGLGLAFVGFKAVGAASDVEEMRSKFNVVFGSLANEVEAWADVTAKAVNRSKFDFIGYLASLQDTFVPMGIARGKAAEMSKALVELAVDVGSFNNLATGDVIRDFQAALVGSSEVMRKYGVVITAVGLEQEILNQGWANSVKEITPAMKLQATMNLIIAGTSDAQGDATRTAGSFANQMQALKASVRDVVVEFGTALLPVASQFVDILISIVGFVDGLNPEMIKWAALIGGVGAAFGLIGGPILLFLGFLPSIIGGVTALIGAFTTLKVLLSGPIGLLALGVALGAGAAAVVGVKKFASFDTGGRVPEDMLAQIHKGEIIIPENMARNMPSFQKGTLPIGKGTGFRTAPPAPPILAVPTPTTMDPLLLRAIESMEDFDEAARKWAVANHGVVLTLEDLGVAASNVIFPLDIMGDEIINLERITKGAASAISDEFVYSLAALNQAGPRFGETLKFFTDLGFDMGQAYDLTAIKIGKEFNDSLNTVLGSMEGGESILAGMTEGLISQQDVLDILVEKYGGMEEAVKHFADATNDLKDATKGATEELITFNDLVLLGQFQTRVRGGRPEIVTWGGAGGPEAMGVPSFMEDPKVVEQLLLSTAGMADPAARERRLRGYGVSNEMMDQFSDLIDRINIEEIFTREAASAFEKAYNLIISGADPTVLAMSERQTQDISDLFEGNAKGGIVTRPTIALLGEAGPEAIIPLRGGGAGMAPVYNITISDNTVFGEMDFKRLVVDAVTDSHRRGGLPFLGKA